MTKPSGTLEYSIVALAGAGGVSTTNTFVTLDVKGHTFGGQIPATALLEAVFVASALGAATSNAGRCRVTRTPTIAGDFLTGLSVTVTNDSPGAGDTVTGTLYVRINHGENMAI